MPELVPLFPDHPLPGIKRHGRPRSTWQAVPGWFMSLCVHAALSVCLLFGFDHLDGRKGTGGGAGRMIELVSNIEGDSSGTGFSTELDVEAGHPRGNQLDRERPANVELTAPVAEEEPPPEQDVPSDPVANLQDSLTEGPAVLEQPPVTDNRVRVIKSKYRELLQETVARNDDSVADAFGSEGRAGKGRTVGKSLGRGRGTGLGTGSGSGTGEGHGGGTSFSDIGGAGNVFCYVVDCSSSMDNEDAIGMARAELMASIDQLDVKQRFQILFYNSELHPLSSGRQRTFYATAEWRKFARQFIVSQQTEGGTVHQPALLAALQLTPDVIFFLTDGETPELSSRQLAELKRANRKRIQIHVVQFGVGAKLGAPNWLEQLAADHRGNYRYQDLKLWQAAE